jgi:hypothetical protein
VEDLEVGGNIAVHITETECTWTGCIWLKTGTGSGSCENFNELSDSIPCAAFPDNICDCYLVCGVRKFSYFSRHVCLILYSLPSFHFYVPSLLNAIISCPPFRSFLF